MCLLHLCYNPKPLDVFVNSTFFERTAETIMTVTNTSEVALCCTDEKTHFISLANLFLEIHVPVSNENGGGRPKS